MAYLNRLTNPPMLVVGDAPSDETEGFDDTRRRKTTADIYYDLTPILIDGLKRLQCSRDAETRSVANKTLRKWDKARGTQ